MNIRRMTKADFIAMVAQGYHCEWKFEGCTYRPAPHFLRGHYTCDACKPEALLEPEPELPPLYYGPSRYNFHPVESMFPARAQTQEERVLELERISPSPRPPEENIP